MSAAVARPTADLRRRLLAWYDREHRDFPWRRTRDPYAVLVSEVMLQQTQAARVVEAFGRFMARFPTADALAAAPEAQVLAAWSGLGYNRRALALRRAAASVTTRGWPSSVSELERLPGVGPYTARAIASLAFDIPVGVVDTNVRRWLTRRFGLPTNARPSDLQALADALATADGGPPEGRPAAWTHASMEFGAAVCSARRPRCQQCPIAVGCPSRVAPRSVPVPRQSPFSGSDREARGALLRALSAADGHVIGEGTARQLAGDERLARVAAALERDGLLHRDGSRLRLGGPAAERATTIGP